MNMDPHYPSLPPSLSASDFLIISKLAVTQRLIFQYSQKRHDVARGKLWIMTPGLATHAII